MNLVARRTREEDITECSGCGKPSKVLYELMGRRDYETDDYKGATIFLCYKCFWPLKSRVEMIKTNAT